MIYLSLIVLASAAVVCCSTPPFSESPCGVNEARYPCGRRCEERCNAELPRLCKGLMCLGFACRCKNGYARNPVTQQCVKIENCPANECAYGEVLGACGRTCEGTCSNQFEPEICQRIDCAGASCRCDLTGGFVRDEQTKQCVRTNKCPNSDIEK